MKTLLLNSDWTPLNFVSPVRALSLLFKGRAELIAVSDGPSIWNDALTTPSTSYEAPATIRLLRRIPTNWPTPRFRKRVLFNRDGWKCQYCCVKLDWNTVTIDHVLPRSRGGQTSWKNCVAACKKCNIAKGSRTPNEAGMKLVKNPSDPAVNHFWETADSVRSSWHDDWRVFFESPTYNR